MRGFAMSSLVNPTPFRRLRWTLLSTPSKTKELLARTFDDSADTRAFSNNAEPIGLGVPEFSKRVSPKLKLRRLKIRGL
jgi:hypothetical protein